MATRSRRTSRSPSRWRPQRRSSSSSKSRSRSRGRRSRSSSSSETHLPPLKSFRWEGRCLVGVCNEVKDEDVQQGKEMQQYLVSNQGFKGIWQEPPPELQGSSGQSITYVKVSQGQYAGLEAAAIGGNSTKRERTACFALVLAALATMHRPELLQKLIEWYHDVQQHMQELARRLGPPAGAAEGSHQRPQRRDEGLTTVPVPKARPPPRVSPKCQELRISQQQQEGRLQTAELLQEQLTTETAAYRQLQDRLRACELAEQMQQQLEATRQEQERQLQGTREAEVQAELQQQLDEQRQAAGLAELRQEEQIATEAEAQQQLKRCLRDVEEAEQQKHQQLASEAEVHSQLERRLRAASLAEQQQQRQLETEISARAQLQDQLQSCEDSEEQRREASLRHELALRRQVAELEKQQQLLQSRLQAAELAEQRHQEQMATEAKEVAELRQQEQMATEAEAQQQLKKCLRDVEEADSQLQSHLQAASLAEQQQQRQLETEISARAQLQDQLQSCEDLEEQRREASLRHELALRRQVAELEKQQQLLQSRLQAAELAEQRHQEQMATEAKECVAAENLCSTLQSRLEESESVSASSSEKFEAEVRSLAESRSESSSLEAQLGAERFQLQRARSRCRAAERRFAGELRLRVELGAAKEAAQPVPPLGSDLEPKPPCMEAVDGALLEVSRIFQTLKLGKRPDELGLARVMGGVFVSGVELLAPQNLAKLKEHSITHVVSCIEDAPLLPSSSGIQQLVLQCVDTPSYPILSLLKDVIAFLDTKGQGAALLHCHLGMNRSMALALALRMRRCFQGDGSNQQDATMLLQHAWSLAAERRGCHVVTNPGFRRQLMMYAMHLVETKAATLWPSSWGPELWLPESPVPYATTSTWQEERHQLETWHLRNSNSGALDAKSRGVVAQTLSFAMSRKGIATLDDRVARARRGIL
eukprot:TRINITY_DN7140_c0_g1_i1.p1 TRINITY_DN7140_c0_g1~~TRINITY_DN7140_c0_g1_i1.p1  ORF type:complete len:936 (-),score=269.68 TRINITY_DN7140_c0_g1_i1:9-2816(-)